MIRFRQLSDEHPDFVFSPLLRAARLTLSYMVENGPIGITKTKSCKRYFVQWAVQHFEWPDMGYEDLMRYHKVLNEHDFQPLDLLHFLLVELKLARHFKDELRLTKRGRDVAHSPNALFQLVIPFYILGIDHAAYGRFDEGPMGNWDTWLNVLNVEVENGLSEADLFAQIYGHGSDWHNAGWREMAAFSTCVLKPLEWSGLLSIHEAKTKEHAERMCFKTPLWRSALIIDTDGRVRPARRH